MKRLVLNITNRCNFKCKHCFRENTLLQDLPYQTVKKVFKELKQMQINNVALTGGEPILYPWFEDILKLIADNEMRFGLVSNGWRYEDYYSMLESYHKKIDYIAFSLDGHNALLHDKLRRKGSFDRALSAIKLFREKGYKVNVSHCVNRYNYNELPNFLKFIKPFDVSVIIGRVVKSSNNKSVQLTTQQISMLRSKIKMLRKKYDKMVLGTSSLGMNPELCFCTNFNTLDEITLRFDGKVTFCCDAPVSDKTVILGNVNEEKLQTIIPRFGEYLGGIYAKRIEAMVNNEPLKRNDCDFCIQLMEKLGATRRASL